jgi:nitrile hydratase subunit beta
MNSIHDLGGMHGMGPLPFEQNEPVFHEDWERGAFGVNILLLITGLYTADESRHAMERIPALRWLGSSYYAHWIDGVRIMMLEKGIITEEELQTGKASEGLPEWVANLKPVEVEEIAQLALTNFPVTGDDGMNPAFREGDLVRARNINPRTHTRLPRYIRGHVGRVERYAGPLLYADDRAHGKPESARHTYTVRFEGAELWGPDAGPKDALYIDLYETYLEAA